MPITSRPSLVPLGTMFYAPMVDISRAARWGRTAGGSGEDAFLLLQNKAVTGSPALALGANAKIALIGPMADTRDVQGAWGGGRGEDSITVRAGLGEWAAAHGGSVVYARGTGRNDVDSTSRAHIDLPGNQQQLIDRVTSLGKPVVLVLFSGRPLVLTAVVPKVDSMLEVWFPGTEAGHAVARVLYR